MKKIKMRDTKTNKLIIQKWDVPNQSILQKIKTTKWTAHNIPLTRFDTTMNNSNQPPIGDEVRTKTIKRILYKLASRNGSLDGLSLIDLGCLEGGIAFEMAREDMNVIGIEGRESNYSKCQLIKKYFKLPNLQFQHFDVKNLNKEVHGVFDIVLCLGLLYHLDNPVSFLNILNEITHETSLLFIDTHIAPASQESIDDCVFKDNLSKITQFEYNGKKYEGCWFQEFVEKDKATDNAWAAVRNYRSFWLTQTYLFKALYFAGFKNIYNLYGLFEIDEEFNLRNKYSRLWCIAVKESYFGQF